MSLGVPEVSPWVSVWSLYAIPNALGSLHSQSFGGVGGVSVLSLRVPEPPPPRAGGCGGDDGGRRGGGPH